MSFRFLSLLILICLAAAQCPISQDIDNLVSGTLNFVNSNLDKQSIVYTFKTPFGVIPKVALAIQHFDVKSGNHGNFSVTTSLVRVNDITFNFSRTAQLWNKLRVNFLASARSDLVIGSSSQSFSGIFNTSAISTVQFESQVPNYSRSIIRVFLTGYEYKGSLVDIQVSGRKLQAQQLLISIDVENDFYLLKVYYSFVVFAPSNIPFASYGGLIAQNNFTGLYYEDANKIISNSKNIIYGLNKITLSGQDPIQFASLIDENFVAGLYSSRNFDELNLIYIVLGIAPASQCSKCSSTEVFAYQSGCLSQCPVGTYAYQYNDKGSACRVCSQKLNQVLMNGVCVCNLQSVQKDGVCVLTQGKAVNFLTSIIYDNLNNTNNATNASLGSYAMNTSTSAPLLVSPIFVNQTTTSQNNTCTGANQYWTGYRCTCKVGYKNDSDNCIVLTLQKAKNWVQRQPAIISNDTDNTNTTNQTVTIPNNCFLSFEYFNGYGCVCINGYNRVGGVCVISSVNQNITKCQSLSNREWVNGSCNCKTGFLLVNGDCIQITTGTCAVNSYDNGLGTCICDQGYYKDTITQQCVKGTPCPPSSSRNINGTCICDSGLTMYNGYCAKCPLGAIWDTNTSKCVYVCGQNAKYNETSQKCQCLTGFGIASGVCAKCSNNYFIRNNYCVQCTQNAQFNQSSGNCNCKDGYLLNIQGVCVSKCANGEAYDTVSGTCKCVVGLGRAVANASCQICPNNTLPSVDTQICGTCRVNQINIDGQCVCVQGYAPNAMGLCVDCGSLDKAFLINGMCAFCPGDLSYNNISKKCQCEIGKFKSGIKCYDSCKSDELIDNGNSCYSCPINEIILNGQCSCKSGYVRNNFTSVCEITCKQNEFIYKGRCAACPLNLQYRSEIQGCACPDGLYINTYGVCQKIILTPVTCDSGYFFDTNNGCVKCPNGCSNCSSANSCTTCSQTGYRVNNGKCEPFCGDGNLVIGQSCDDGNNFSNDGCSSNCTIENFYTCTGIPSVCKYNGPAICGNGRIQGTETCDDGNTINGDGCSSKCQKETVTPNNTFGNITLVGDINTNINNVFIVLKTSKKYSFTNQNDMESFMKSSFPDSTSFPTVYCSQREDPDLDVFDCLALYSSGIPNKKFNIVFSFDYNGDKGKIQVEVDPLNSSIISRSRKI